MSTWSLTYRQSVSKRYHSDRHFSEFYLQDGGKNQLARIRNKITSLSPYAFHATTDTRRNTFRLNTAAADITVEQWVSKVSRRKAASSPHTRHCNWLHLCNHPDLIPGETPQNCRYSCGLCPHLTQGFSRPTWVCPQTPTWVCPKRHLVLQNIQMSHHLFLPT